MAKRFGGFTPEQLGRIVPEMANMQSDEQAKFLAANPAAAARVGAMTDKARKMIEGKPSFATGGLLSFVNPILSAASSALPTGAAKVADEPLNDRVLVNQPNPVAKNVSPQDTLDAAQQAYADQLRALENARAAQAANPEDEALVQAVTDAQANVNRAQEAQQSALDQFKATSMPSTAELLSQATTDPTSMVTQADVETFTPDQVAAGVMDASAGDAGAATDAAATTAETAAPITAPVATPAQTVTAVTSGDATQAVVDKLVAATGKPSAEAIAEAATMTPDQLSALGINAAQLDQARQVIAPEARTLQAGEIVEGPTVDMARVEQAVNFAAATGAPSTDATVQGQLTSLMADFEGNNPPAWAAGALRAATAQMAARGLAASSMAGQAAVQAAMESALPIAMQDAQTAAQFEITNLSNKQQTAMFAAQQRAQFLGMEFDQKFQARVANAAKISEIANMNFTAAQQVALENAQLAQTVDLANLNNRQAKVMADMATLSQMDMTNLNNRQQAQVQNAQAFLQMDMSNLNNTQQANIFRTQSLVNSVLSDQAAQNAAAQFNASSQQQTDQFFANLTAQVSQFNVDQQNAMSKFNAGETNALAQFNAAQRSAREQFNAQNNLVIEQANAQWYQSIATTENAQINQANRDAAAAASAMTLNAFNAMMQESRDIMSYAFQSADNDATRATNLAIAKYNADSSRDIAATDAAASKSSGFWGALGSVAAAILR